jgi:hypothetical protein
MDLARAVLEEQTKMQVIVDGDIFGMHGVVRQA